MSRDNTAFEGLRPAAGRADVSWVVKAMAGRQGVDLVVPAQFETYARIHVATKLVFIDGDGNLDAEKVDALVPLLAAETAAPNECHFALWEGWAGCTPDR